MHALLRAEPPARRQWAVLAQRQQPQDRRPHLHSAIEGTHRAANVIGTDGIPGDREAIDAPHPAAGNIDPVGPAKHCVREAARLAAPAVHGEDPQ